ncbi:MAG: AEC family transporter [Ruminococcaceae bacterium]|nr:AEC family transporter [Oscillospiraceae bacterium]
MESIKLSFEAVFPIFVLMALGYGLRAFKVADKKAFDAINKLVFKIFLPVLLFNNIYKISSPEVFSIRLIVFTLVCIAFIYVMGYLVVLFLTDDNSKRGVLLQAFFRSNYAILGVPLAGYICKGSQSGLTSLMVAFIVPLFNILAVITFERFRGKNPSHKKIIKGVVTNPLIIGCVAGVIMLALNIKLPKIIEKSIDDIGKIASPLSIIVLGAGFTFSAMKGYVKELCVISAVRLVIVPMIAVSAAVMLGFSGEALVCILIAFASPVAVSSFAMAQQMGGDEKLAAQAVVTTSCLCLITLFLWIFILSYLGLF